MKPIVVLYSTREGHTRRIAEHLAATLRARGHAASARDVSMFGDPLTPDGFKAVILTASVHLGKHEPEMISFVRRHREALERVPAAFLSVSLSAATAEDETRPASARAEADASVHKALDTFAKETGWHPSRAKAVAGALLYTQYGVVVRFVMKMLAKRAGHPTDTSRDYVYTDWRALDRFLDEIAEPLAMNEVGTSHHHP